MRFFALIVKQTYCVGKRMCGMKSGLNVKTEFLCNAVLSFLFYYDRLIDYCLPLLLALLNCSIISWCGIP